MAAAKGEGAAHCASEVATDLVELGYLRGAYGLRGWSHVQPYWREGEVLRAAREWWLLPPEATGAQAISSELVKVTGVRSHGAGLVAKWHGCENPEAAQARKGWRVAVPREAFPPLPEGQYYWVDLIGALVVNRSARLLGVVRGLRSNGAQDLLEVERADAGGLAPNPILIPIVAAYIDAVDLAGRQIRVDWELQW